MNSPIYKHIEICIVVVNWRQCLKIDNSCHHHVVFKFMTINLLRLLGIYYFPHRKIVGQCIVGLYITKNINIASRGKFCAEFELLVHTCFFILLIFMAMSSPDI